MAMRTGELEVRILSSIGRLCDGMPTFPQVRFTGFVARLRFNCEWAHGNRDRYESGTATTRRQDAHKLRGLDNSLALRCLEGGAYTEPCTGNRSRWSGSVCWAVRWDLPSKSAAWPAA